jgi:glycosyltransferase involved in cell wall biosynthesis
MVGAGEEKRRELETKVAQCELSDKIRFLGTRSDVPWLMLASDLLLFPSLAEGLGMVVVEAQAAGLPVLASDSTPHECVVVSDLVEFISLSETPEQWSAQALRMLETTVREVEEPNRAVRESAFSIDHSAARLINLYSGGALSH